MLALIGRDGLAESGFYHIFNLQAFPLGDDTQLLHLLGLDDGAETLYLLFCLKLLLLGSGIAGLGFFAGVLGALADVSCCIGCLSSASLVRVSPENNASRRLLSISFPPFFIVCGPETLP